MAKSVIKLNVPKREEDEMVNNPYACLTCNKSFSNGKAFGGHKRIHSLKKKGKTPVEVINLEFYEDEPSHYNCLICPKTFRAESSFKRHQKTHLQVEKPNGTVEPSMTASNGSASSTTSTDVILVQDDPVKLENDEEHEFLDMSKFLPLGWLRTGKRSLVAGGLVQISSSEDVHQVANNLIVLSQGAARAEDFPVKKRKMELPTFEAMTYQHEETVLDYKGKGKGLAFVATSSGDVKEEVEEISGDIICRKCNRSFASYQALGGHSSHHKKAHTLGGRNSHHKRAVKTESSVRFPKSNGSSSSNPAECASGRWPHKCSFCNKSFKTSQALAGHKRHCRAPVPPAPIPLASVPLAQVAVEKINEEAIVQVPKRAHPFDLNELPPHEDDDGVEDRNMVQPQKSTLRLTWHEEVGDPGSSSARTGEEN